MQIHIIGGGLAGTEAAWQLARRGLPCVLHEMRPVRSTPAHQTDRLAELVCSNSLKSESENTAPWLLKEELRRLDSLLLQAAAKARVPGGHALTVDRGLFAEEVTRAIAGEPLIDLRRDEVTTLTPDAIWIVASGPLTSGALAEEIAALRSLAVGGGFVGNAAGEVAADDGAVFAHGRPRVIDRLVFEDADVDYVTRPDGRVRGKDRKLLRGSDAGESREDQEQDRQTLHVLPQTKKPPAMASGGSGSP